MPKSLLTSVLDIAELVGGEQQVSGLLDAEAIVLEHLAREDDMLWKTSIDIMLEEFTLAGWFTLASKKPSSVLPRLRVAWLRCRWTYLSRRAGFESPDRA